MNRQSGRIGLYLVLVAMLIFGYFYLNDQVMTAGSYTMESLEEAVEEGNVVSARIYQNREVPTGSVSIELANGEREVVNVTYVTETEAFLEENGIYPVVEDVPEDITYGCAYFVHVYDDDSSDVRRRK